MFTLVTVEAADFMQVRILFLYRYYYLTFSDYPAFKRNFILERRIGFLMYILKTVSTSNIYLQWSKGK